MTAKPPLNLTEYEFTANIDYVSLVGLQKTALPPLNGKATWPPSVPGKLTVQEPSAADVQALAETFPAGHLDELEICVDVRTAQQQPAAQQEEALTAFKAEFVAKRHKPTFIEGTNSGFRGAYDHNIKKTLPYNHRVPAAHQQLLNGHRNDGAQVKCYYKRTDQKQALPSKQHCVRLEIRLGMVGLDRHGLLTLADLHGFKFRKELMPYFTHVYGSRHPKVRKSSRAALLGMLNAYQDSADLTHWGRVGVGAFLPGGKREKPHLIFKRDTALNNRIGQALGRLERSFAIKKFVRPAVPA